MAHRLLVLIALLSTWLVGTANARAADCGPLKPEQRLSEQQAREVEAALRGGSLARVAGRWGVGSAPTTRSSSRSSRRTTSREAGSCSRRA